MRVYLRAAGVVGSLLVHGPDTSPRFLCNTIAHLRLFVPSADADTNNGAAVAVYNGATPDFFANEVCNSCRWTGAFTTSPFLSDHIFL